MHIKRTNNVILATSLKLIIEILKIIDIYFDIL